MQSIHDEFQRAFNGRKAIAKQAFIKAGGYDDVPGALGKPPESMEPENWEKAIEFFQTPEHRKVSESNAQCRGKQPFPNRGGSQKFCSASFKLQKPRVEIFRKAKTNKDGTFDDPRVEQQALELERAYNDCTQEGGTPNEVEIFENVLGARRGHIKGIGRKPSGVCRVLQTGESSQPPPPQSKTKQELMKLFEEPGFMEKLIDFLDAYKRKDNGDEDEQEDEDEDEDLDLE